MSGTSGLLLRANHMVLALGFGEIGLILAALCLAMPLYIFIYNVYFHPLASFPGPKLYGGFEIMKIYQQITGNIHRKVHSLHEQYGDVVRVAPWELSYTSAAAWGDIYGGRQGRGCIPPNPAYGMRETELFGTLSLLWLRDAGEHARHRRALGPAFSARSLAEQEGVVRKYVDLLMQRMRENAAAGTAVDLAAWMNYTTFDIIGDLAFGEPFGCLEQSRFHPWVHFLLSRLKMMMYGQIMLTMGGWLGAVVEMLVPKALKDEGMRHVALTKDKVDRRVARHTNRPDFMTHILGGGNNNNNNNNEEEEEISSSSGNKASRGGRRLLSQAELYADANILVIAGSETSATLLANTIYCLLRNPAAMARLAREVRGAFADEDEIRFGAASRLRFLNAVISESLRVRPPLPAGIHRKVGRGGALVEGRFVAEGASLQVTHWAAYHSARNFAEPDAFVPERWIMRRGGGDGDGEGEGEGEGGGGRGRDGEGEGERKEGEELTVPIPEDARFAGDNRDVFQPFSFGTRNCIGRNLAYMETRLVLARMIWSFDMEPMPESRDWADQRVFMLYEKLPLMVKMTPVVRP